MWMHFRKRVGGGQRENADATRMFITSAVNPRRLIRNLDEAVARYASLLADVVQRGLHIVVHMPRTLKQRRDDVLVALLRRELDAATETEVSQIAREGADVIERQIGVAHL